MRAFYLDGNLVLFEAAEGAGPAVLLVPPLGWDDVCSYRARYAWSLDLAAAGHPALRLELPGTGDSGGAPDVDSWIAAVDGAAAWLRRETGRRVVAIGIGVGGLLAWAAAAGGAPIDDLVLWGTPAKGRALVRELRAFARLEAATLGDQVDPGSDGGIVAGGFVVPAETATALEAIVLAPLPDAERRRLLLLERDGLPVDPALRDSPGEVTVRNAAGYAEMMNEPQFSRAPLAVFEEVRTWLAGAPREPLTADAAPPHVSESLELHGVRETPVASGDVFAIRAEPTGAPAGVEAVLLNAGSVRRIGPNRMWVEIARRWAARGVTTLRIDVPGVGDAGGETVRFADVPSYYVEPVVAEVRAALDELAGRRLVVAGLCSGGYWALQTALEDERVRGAMLLNTGVLVWDDVMLHDRRLQPLRENATRALRERNVRELAQISRVVVRRLAAVVARRRGGDRIDRAFDRLRDEGKQVVLLYEDLDPQRWELERDGRLASLSRWPNLVVERIAGKDHTLRPPAMQQQAHEALDRALERVLAQPPP